MRVVCISDTHMQLDNIKIPDGDLLIHAGDLTYGGTVQEVSQEAYKLEKLLPKFTHGIVLIPGNHDHLAEDNEQLFKEILGNVQTLVHESVTIDGHKIFGSPYTPWFHDWAFNVHRGNLKLFWDQIPEDTEILVTHGPPYKILDKCPNGHVGDAEILERIKQLPKLSKHIFGHIHESHGVENIGNVNYINASSCNGQYKPVNKPIIFEI